MAGDDHGNVAGRLVDPVFQLEQLAEIEMVGWFVQQQGIGLQHPAAGDQGDALPAAAQFRQPAVTHGVGGFELVEHDIDPPAIGVALCRRQGFEYGVIERQPHARRRHVLLDIADGKATRAHDIAGGQFPLPGHGAQQRGLAAAIAGDEADAVAV